MSASVAEWIIADGLGGYAMGTRDGIRTRRYHGLLLVASPGTEQRFMLVNGVEAWLDTPTGSIALNSHRYVPGTVHPDGATHITRYFDVGAAWDLSWADGDVRHSIAGVYGNAATVLRWRVGGNAPATLRVRLQMSGRDWHALHHENPVFRSEPTVGEAVWRFQPYNAVPPVMVHASARYRHAPLWFRQLQYDEERARGQDFIEDLCSPGEFTFEVTPDQREAVMVLTTSEDWGGLKPEGDVVQAAATASVPDVTVGPWSRVADTFVATRGERRTIIAGYPWFTDWGRDTFISVRGLCITLGRLADAEAILSSWCEHLSQGMMPNLFPSGAGAPEYNSVDASLWFIVAVHDLAKAVAGGGVPQVPLKFVKACEEILTHYSRGTRHNIRVDSDGLLAAGAAGIALTWMDAIVDGRPVTPRIGKPVEVQALWINALEFASSWNTRWRAAAARARDSFAKRFWNEARGCLYDVVDVDHVAGAADDRVRPNQVFAIGGLPVAVVDGARAESIFAVLQGELATKAGLRTLSPSHPEYIGRVDGPLRQRDLGYHQGTVWPWLSCAFEEAASRQLKRAAPPPAVVAWLTGRGEREAVTRYEIADGDAPHTPRGCPWQAWSVGESTRGLLSPRARDTGAFEPKMVPWTSFPSESR